MNPRGLWACAALLLVACEDEQLFDIPPTPDVGFVDAGFVDAGFVDSGVREIRDAGFLTPDSGVTPDAGFPPPAEEPVYIHTGESLFSYDPDANTPQLIGQFRDRNGPLERQMVDIAIDLDGRMYGGTRHPQGEAQGNEIYLIDPGTGFCTLRFTFDDVLNGMTFLDDGRLVVAGERVSVVDPTNGQLLLEFPAAQAYETSGDIVGLPDGNLYWTVRGDDADEVVRIDPITGRTTELGPVRLRSIFGLGYADNQLFGFSSTGNVVVIDPSNGRVLNQRTLEGRWFGATTNPVVWD